MSEGDRSKRRSAALAAALLFAAVSACSVQPDPPPSFPTDAFSGTGDLMARCMQFASQSYCEQQVWGGGEP